MIALGPIGAGAALAGEVRLAVVATRNEGLAREEPLRYADLDGDRVSRVLVDLGAFAPEHVFRVQGATVDGVAVAIGRAVVAASAAREAGDDVTLLVYYTGHAALDGLHLGDEVWSLAELKAAARVVPAAERIFVVDACQAGQLFRSQGAALQAVTDAPPDFVPPPDEAWLTSSGPEERAFEIEDRRGALFTHYFVSGARGAADADADARVSLGELYAFAHRQTSSAAADLGLVQEPRWAGELGSFLLTDLSLASTGLDARGPVPSPILVVRADDGEVAGEIPAGAGGRLALDPGRYQLVALDDGRRPRVGTVSIDSRDWLRVDVARELVEVRGVRTKGGLFDDHPVAVVVGGAADLGALPGVTVSGAAAVGLRASVGRGHHLTLGGAASAGPVRVAAYEGTARAVAAVAEWRYDVAWRVVRAGPAVEARAGWLDQRAERVADPTWGAWFGSAQDPTVARAPVVGVAPGAALAVPVGSVWLTLFGGAGARAALGTPVAEQAYGTARLGLEVPW